MTIVGAIGVVVLAIGAAYGSWRFFTSVDEVEVADNLWASLIGFYAYASSFRPGGRFRRIRLADATRSMGDLRRRHAHRDGRLRLSQVAIPLTCQSLEIGGFEHVEA